MSSREVHRNSRPRREQSNVLSALEPVRKDLVEILGRNRRTRLLKSCFVIRIQLDLLGIDTEFDTRIEKEVRRRSVKRRTLWDMLKLFHKGYFGVIEPTLKKPHLHSSVLILLEDRVNVFQP